MTEPYYKVETLEPMKSIGFLIKRCGVMMSQLAERRFESQQISFTQWLVLIRLRFHDHMSATRLSEELGHDMGALTRLVDTLERAGLVRRERSRQDRRAVEIAITAEGRRTVEACMGFMVGLMNELVEPYTKEEMETLIRQLQRLMLRLQEFVERVPRGPAKAAPAAAPARKRAARRSRTKRDHA
ncbi:MAG TPA: MarR family winged helix-turn-helix transcriptional regulator [Nevskia sp.]|jgi:DNA-binding MarR family transcriptional regulator|nr:MarR family winged helix-turn-helix transcriptional regulator [Nevskia sp.]